jgi:hypothetical protein
MTSIRRWYEKFRLAGSVKKYILLSGLGDLMRIVLGRLSYRVW